MKAKKIEEKIEIPGGIELEIINSLIKVKGPKGELQRGFKDAIIKITKQDNLLLLSANKPSKREKTKMGSFKAHIKNMIKGVKEGFTYKLKVCSSHFPVTVSIKDNNLEVHNFMGAKIPKKIKIPGDVTVKLEGDIIIVESIDIEAAGKTATNIEQITRITDKDRRVFQDGIYLINRSGKTIK